MEKRTPLLILKTKEIQHLTKGAVPVSVQPLFVSKKMRCTALRL